MLEALLLIFLCRWNIAAAQYAHPRRTRSAVIRYTILIILLFEWVTFIACVAAGMQPLHAYLIGLAVALLPGTALTRWISGPFPGWTPRGTVSLRSALSNSPSDNAPPSRRLRVGMYIAMAGALAVGVIIGALSGNGPILPDPDGDPSLPAVSASQYLTAEVQTETTVPEGFTGIYSTNDLLQINDATGGNYILMVDLNLLTSAANPWQPLCAAAPFTGHFNGNGHIISGLYISASESGTELGLFAEASGSIIENLVVDGEIHMTDDINDACAGGIVGCYYGSGTELGRIYNCSFKGSIAGAFQYTGGIVGSLWIEPEGDMALVSHCANYASLSGSNTGGIVGYLDNSIAGGVAMVVYSNNFGIVHALGEETESTRNAGGIVAIMNIDAQGALGTIQGCANLGEVASLISAGGIVGRPNVDINGVLSITANCNIGSVSGSMYASGIVTTQGIAFNSSVNMSHCYNSGFVGGTNSGALINGQNLSITASDCYYSIEISTLDAHMGTYILPEQLRTFDSYLILEPLYTSSGISDPFQGYPMPIIEPLDVVLARFAEASEQTSDNSGNNASPDNPPAISLDTSSVNTFVYGTVSSNLNCPFLRIEIAIVLDEGRATFKSTGDVWMQEQAWANTQYEYDFDLINLEYELVDSQDGAIIPQGDDGPDYETIIAQGEVIISVFYGEGEDDCFTMRLIMSN